MEQMLQDSTLSLLLISLSEDTYVQQAEAVIGHKNCELVHVGDSVEFSSNPSEVGPVIAVFDHE